MNRHPRTRGVAIVCGGMVMLCLTVCLSDLVADEPASVSVQNLRMFMRAKLANSQNVMEGLVVEDFELIRRAADEMKSMSRAAEWPRTRDTNDVYEHFAAGFRRQCSKLARHAASKNLEAAHYTYLEMTSTCIDCHNYVRGRYHVARDTTSEAGTVQLIPNHWDDVPVGVPSPIDKLDARGH